MLHVLRGGSACTSPSHPRASRRRDVDTGAWGPGLNFIHILRARCDKEWKFWTQQAAYISVTCLTVVVAVVVGRKKNEFPPSSSECEWLQAGSFSNEERGGSLNLFAEYAVWRLFCHHFITCLCGGGICCCLDFWTVSLNIILKESRCGSSMWKIAMELDLQHTL